ncbi:unnamed protein product [Owenia fusiformis]|uniref:Uncharacterized protein n=1 Tax=Owenia fusiformis TaxID=6347 RepID=A0A8S4NTB9_OWEFU|nr:unnamed protein product [Owenia fusiformis]
MAFIFDAALTTMVLVAALFARVYSAPVPGNTPTWNNPCGDGTSLTDPDTTADPAWASVAPGDVTHSEYYNEVSKAAGRAKRSVEDLQNQFVVKGRISTRRISSIANMNLDHMPVAPALSEAKEMAHHEDSLRRARTALSEVSVFVKHMIEEEENVFIGHTASSLLAEMKSLEQKYLYGGVMCNVHHTMIATKVSHDFDFAHESQIRDSIVDLLGEEEYRNMVNFIILRDMGKLFEFHELEFVELAKIAAS